MSTFKKMAVEEFDELNAKYQRLLEAAKWHRAQKADDRCVNDDDKLYEAIGDGIKCDRRVGSQFCMIKNCIRFVENRTEEGGWPTYVELEAKIKQLEEMVSILRLQLRAKGS